MNRKLTRALCVALLAAVMSLSMFGAAFAASGKITTDNTPHIFQSYANNRWSDLKTPKHTLTVGGKNYLAYCLQHKKSTPKGQSYPINDVMSSYSAKARNGIYAIILNGYPYNANGMNANTAFYATANALRCWLAECGDNQHYNMSNLSSLNASKLRTQAASGTINSHLKVKDAANIPALQFMVELLICARNQELPAHDIGVSVSELELHTEGSYYVGTTNVTITNLRGGYKIDASTLPTGSSITGYTGKANDTLTISIPSDTSNAGQVYTITLTGYDDRVPQNVQAYNPSDASYQRMAGVYNGNMVEVCSTTITVKTSSIPLPDLTITSLTTDKSTYAGGEKIIVSATVLNQGQLDAAAFETAVEVEGSQSRQAPTESLAVGGSTVLKYEFTAPVQNEAQTLDVLAFTDCAMAVPEMNEYNNDATTQVSVSAAQPDLVISSIKTDKETYDAGDTITVTVVVKNKGNASSGPFDVSLAATDQKEQTKAASSLGAGSSTTLKYTYTAPTRTSPMTMRFDGYADCNYAVQESNEGNNDANTSAKINAGLPDLTVTVVPNPGTVKPGETVTFAVAVQNQGYRGVDTADVKLYINGTEIGAQATQQVPSGGFTTFTFEYTVPEDTDAGTLEVLAKVDPDERIPELREDNNTAQAAVVVEELPPDLSVVDTNAKDWYGGTDVVVTATIRNHSPKGVPSVVVRLNFCGKTWEDRICVPGRGDNLAVFRITLPDGSGEANVDFVVDPNNEVEELREDNNELTRKVELVDMPTGKVVDPDDPDMEAAFQNGHASLPSPDKSNSHTWQEYRYIDGSFVLKEYWASFEISANLSVDQRVAYEEHPELLESGFGVQIGVTTTLTTNYDHPEKLVGAQRVWCWSPESGYGQFSGFSDVFDSLEIKEGERGGKEIKWRYKENPHSETHSHLHYSPLWFLDGEYRVFVEGIYGWSPAGELYTHTSDAVEVSGDMYDRVTAVD